MLIINNIDLVLFMIKFIILFFIFIILISFFYQKTIFFFLFIHQCPFYVECIIITDVLIRLTYVYGLMKESFNVVFVIILLSSAKSKCGGLIIVIKINMRGLFR